jgi:hypothetical protein
VSTTWLPLAGTEQKAWILHIATHGFFVVDQAPTSGGAKAGATAASSPAGQDPLHRSGLVFAGANRPAANRADDSYLTAAGARSTLHSH